MNKKMKNDFLHKGIRFLKRIRRLFKVPIFWGNLRRIKPVSSVFGYDRGKQSIARYYIDNFIETNSSSIQGAILEIGDNTYSLKHGKNLLLSDVLHVEGSPTATIIADLTKTNSIPDNIYDCIIIPQTFQFIYDMNAAIENSYRILKPGGILLATFTGISQISRFDMDRWGDYWRLTSLSAKKLFSTYFDHHNIDIETHGNVLVATAFLQGLSSHELTKNELSFKDENYEVVITVRAQK
jgi:SAM-dependent methyltransferase